ncbi:hypothetical protein CAI21_07835 [Alkalilimnicola ehrlichii]|uniref:Uncharacterized protein n=1 Tax=Alkalilimnicola ehrlichii TaxID=351052 RepID=A0A3E0WXC0_9GAMM|nr:hypothetical protein [Alkalilimnicola ehrlichii]RFA30102.1 hypothetical protein CAI21_07835 [Alkalilimnicola ehrlichii]RFA37448.1 hypothetical protein CAL65_09180 [Alkalilimnicola ehrlichii]
MDKSQSVIFPDLHDWEIVSVEVDRDGGVVSIDLCSEGRVEEGVLRFQGVKEFYLSGMRMQNVILDFVLFDTDVISEDFSRCCRLLGLDRLPVAVLHGDVMVYIEPSVGAELACRASSVSFFGSDGTSRSFPVSTTPGPEQKIP